MAAIGPLRRFAAAQQDVGNGGRPDGRQTRPEPAVFDPKLSSANVMKPDKFMLVPDDIGGPGGAPVQCGSR
jgi:hypothetical protein